MRTYKTWVSNCKYCGGSLSNNGSGAPKTVCRPCRLKQMRAYSQKRYKPKGASRVVRRMSNKEILNEIKLEIGECVLHPSFNNGERKFVVPGLEYLFDMDHIDRTKKHKTIAKMVGSPELDLRAEAAKCQLLCVECHRRKTVENKDWKSIVKKLASIKDVKHEQLSLFDN